MTADDDQPPAGDTAELDPKRMRPKERQAGWLLVGVAGASVAASLTSGAIDGKNDAVAIGAVGLGLIVGLAVAVWYGHRIITAFAAIIAGFLLFLPVQLACLAYGGYLMFRSSRDQAKVRATQPRRTPAEAREARAAKARKRATVADGPETARRPTQNRRYTPPKTKPARRGR
jgi:hypothetical protein